MTETIIIPASHNGPPNIGQGGFVAGSLAAHLQDTPTISVSLKAPTPLEKPLHLRCSSDGVELVADDQLTAIARPANTLDHLIPPACPSIAAVEGAMSRYRGHADPENFNSCFVCGAHRHDHDALRIFAGPLDTTAEDGDTTVASLWQPSDHFADEMGIIRGEYLWAALDCPGFFATLKRGELALLAQYTVEIYAHPKAGERLIVVGWPLSKNGRKHLVGTALYNENKDLIGKAEGFWLQIEGVPS